MPQLCTVEIYQVRINFQTLHQMYYQFPRVSMCVSGRIADERSCLRISMFPTEALLLCDYYRMSGRHTKGFIAMSSVSVFSRSAD